MRATRRILTLKDAMALTGFLLLIGGAGWVYPPAAPITAGLVMMAAAVFSHLRGKR